MAGCDVPDQWIDRDLVAITSATAVAPASMMPASIPGATAVPSSIAAAHTHPSPGWESIGIAQSEGLAVLFNCPGNDGVAGVGANRRTPNLDLIPGCKCKVTLRNEVGWPQAYIVCPVLRFQGQMNAVPPLPICHIHDLLHGAFRGDLRVRVVIPASTALSQSRACNTRGQHHHHRRYTAHRSHPIPPFPVFRIALINPRMSRNRVCVFSWACSCRTRPDSLVAIRRVEHLLRLASATGGNLASQMPGCRAYRSNRPRARRQPLHRRRRSRAHRRRQS